MLVKCSCEKTLNVPDQFAGKKVRCPACKGTLLAQPIAPVETEQPAEPEEVFAPAGRTESFAREESANHFTGAATSWAPSPAEPEEDQEDVEERRDRKATLPRRSFFQRFAVLLGLGTGLLILGAMYLVYTLVSAEPAPAPGRGSASEASYQAPCPAADTGEAADGAAKESGGRPQTDCSGLHRNRGENQAVAQQPGAVAASHGQASRRGHRFQPIRHPL